MKKLLILILLLFLTGCTQSEPLKSDEGWALHYALEEYESLDDGPEIIGHMIEAYRFRSNDCPEICRIFKVTLITDAGERFEYDVLIIREDTFIWRFFKEDKITKININKI